MNKHLYNRIVSTCMVFTFGLSILSVMNWEYNKTVIFFLMGIVLAESLDEVVSYLPLKSYAAYLISSYVLLFIGTFLYFYIIGNISLEKEGIIQFTVIYTIVFIIVNRFFHLKNKMEAKMINQWIQEDKER